MGTTDRPEGLLFRLRCACGWEATGTEAELIVAAEEHGTRIHNMRPTRAEVLALLVPAEAAGSETRIGRRVGPG